MGIGAAYSETKSKSGFCAASASRRAAIASISARTPVRRGCARAGAALSRDRAGCRAARPASRRRAQRRGRGSRAAWRADRAGSWRPRRSRAVLDLHEIRPCGRFQERRMRMNVARRVLPQPVRHRMRITQEFGIEPGHFIPVGPGLEFCIAPQSSRLKSLKYKQRLYFGFGAVPNWPAA